MAMLRMLARRPRISILKTTAVGGLLPLAGSTLGHASAAPTSANDEADDIPEYNNDDNDVNGALSTPAKLLNSLFAPATSGTSSDSDDSMSDSSASSEPGKASKTDTSDGTDASSSDE